jgi:hypothetical protein
MGFCICNRSTLLIRSWEANAQHQPHDPATEVVVEANAPPDFHTQRWNGATGLRAATAQELTEFDAAKADSEAQGRVDDKLMKAILIYLVQRLNELRTQPIAVLSALTPQTVRDGIVTIYKNL